MAPRFQHGTGPPPAFHLVEERAVQPVAEAQDHGDVELGGEGPARTLTGRGREGAPVAGRGVEIQDVDRPPAPAGRRLKRPRQLPRFPGLHAPGGSESFAPLSPDPVQIRVHEADTLRQGRPVAHQDDHLAGPRPAQGPQPLKSPIRPLNARRLVSVNPGHNHERSPGRRTPEDPQVTGRAKGPG